MKLVWFAIICAIFDATVGHQTMFDAETGLELEEIGIKSIWKKRFRHQSYMTDAEVQVWTLEIPKDVEELCCDEEFKKEVDGLMRWLKELPVRQRKLCMDFAKSLKHCKCEKDKPRANQRPIEMAKCPHIVRNKTDVYLGFKNVDPSSKYCYVFNQQHTGPKSWHNAEFICQQNGGHLVSFHSEEEIKVVTSLSIYSFSWTAWIGLNTGLDGQLKWSDGTQVNYTNYALPSSGLSKGKCTGMSVIDYKWFQSDCNEAKAYFCAVRKISGTVVKPRRVHGVIDDY